MCQKKLTSLEADKKEKEELPLLGEQTNKQTAKQMFAQTNGCPDGLMNGHVEKGERRGLLQEFIRSISIQARRLWYVIASCIVDTPHNQPNTLDFLCVYV